MKLEYPFLFQPDKNVQVWFCELLSYPEYGEYQFGPSFWTRDGRPLEAVHQLRTMTIVKQSSAPS